MDLSTAFERYVKLEKHDAYALYCDEKNLKFLKPFFVGVLFISFINILVSFFEKGALSVEFIFYCIIFVCGILSLFYYKKLFNISNIRRVLIYLLISGFLLFTANAVINTLLEKNKEITIVTSETPPKVKTDTNKTKDETSITVKTDDTRNILSYSFLFCIVILLFKFSRNEIIQLYSLALGIPLIADLIFDSDTDTGNILIFSVLTLILFFISYSAESKRRIKFIKRYNQYVKSNYETIRMKNELDYARQIQLSMLPEPRIKIGELEIAAKSLPAMEVGGDYFDYFKLSDTETGVFICDVSGHGVASALMLSGLRSSMHLVLEDTKNPREIFEKLNRMIRKTQSRKMFVTAIFAVINTGKNTCSLFNAGHLPPYKIDGKTGELFKIKRHGVTLGAIDEIAPDTADSDVCIDFMKGDKLVFYTDGLSEATNHARKEFGFERIEKTLSENSERTPDELLTLITEEVNKFTENSEQHDDLTLLIVSRL
ncbi:MAG: SpoIIE family protein phosphatase [Ignavibacteria bacterium]|nr:SpoIIE family protein phosphatase [Ignavibacteria bacterium]